MLANNGGKKRLKPLYPRHFMRIPPLHFPEISKIACGSRISESPALQGFVAGAPGLPRRSFILYFFRTASFLPQLPLNGVLSLAAISSLAVPHSAHTAPHNANRLGRTLHALSPSSLSCSYCFRSFSVFFRSSVASNFSRRHS